MYTLIVGDLQKIMVKSELINLIANKFEQLPVKDVARGVDRLLELMAEALKKNERIEIRGFGSFCLHKYPPHRAHNPKTGEKVVTIHKYAPHFKPGKTLKERVNQVLTQSPTTPKSTPNST